MANWVADDGSAIHYEVYGDSAGKETLLLLPGLLGAMISQWRAFLPPLAADYRIIYPDLRGHGQSTNNQTTLLPERMLQDIIHLLDYLEVGEHHVAGYSLGGYLGLMLALNQPGRVTTLLMHATKFYWTPEALAGMQGQLDPDIIAAKVPAYAETLQQEHGSSWRSLVRQAADLTATIAENGVTEEMARQSALPVLVSVGDRDELVPVHEAYRLSRTLPQGQLLVLPATRHRLASVKLVPLLPAMQTFMRKA
jgi:pimeloyl-ACP methyl ester carboxylesterase